VDSVVRTRISRGRATIGGLFDDTEDVTVESAFRYALLRINQDRTLLPDTRIVYDIQHLPAQNSFIAAKKGERPH